MIRCLLLPVLLFAFTISTKAQATTTTYPIVLKFLSIGTGVPDAGTVKDFILSFKKKNKISVITADRVGPMGREGEYYLAFALKEMKKKQKVAFIRELKTTTAKYKGRGHFECEEKMQINPDKFSSRTTITKQVF